MGVAPTRPPEYQRDPFVLVLRARQPARERLGAEAGTDAEKRLTLAFKLTTSRSPLHEERAACEKFIAKQKAAYAAEKDADDRAWSDLCQMLLASNAFLYLE